MFPLNYLVIGAGFQGSRRIAAKKNPARQVPDRVKLAMGRQYKRKTEISKN